MVVLHVIDAVYVYDVRSGVEEPSVAYGLSLHTREAGSQWVCVAVYKEGMIGEARLWLVVCVAFQFWFYCTRLLRCYIYAVRSGVGVSSVVYGFSLYT